MTWTRSRTALLAPFAVLAALGLLAPAFVGDYWLGLLTQGLIFALLAASLDVLVGYTGLPSMGHAAFFGIAGYATGLLTVKSGLDPLAAVGLAVAIAAVAGAVFGAIALRARGIAFLVITLALGQVVWGLAIKASGLTGGSDGLPGLFRPVILGVDLADSRTYFTVVTVVVGLSLAVLVLFVRSPFGLVLQGIRDSEGRMEQLGYATWRYQLGAFVVAALFAGVAGVLDAYYNEFVSPEALYFTASATVLLMVIMGSTGTLWGPALFGVVLVAAEHWISDRTEHWTAILGALYVLTVIVAPRGFLRLVQGWGAPRRRRAGGERVAPAVEVPS